MNLKPDLKTLSETLIRLLVRFPDDVDVKITTYTSAVEVNIFLNPIDTPRIIGNGGRNFRAIRTIVGAMAKRQGMHAYTHPIKDCTPTDRAASFDAYQPKSEWAREQVAQAMDETVRAVLAYPEALKIDVEDADGERTIISIVHSASETQATSEILSEHVRLIFNAICRRHGRLAIIDVSYV